MTQTVYFEVISFREHNNKKRPIKIGYAKPRDDGGFNVYLDALPLGDSFVISPQRPREVKDEQA